MADAAWRACTWGDECKYWHDEQYGWNAPENAPAVQHEVTSGSYGQWNSSAGQGYAYHESSKPSHEYASRKANSQEAPQRLSVADQLRELSGLKKEGILTEEEFREQKAKLLARM